MAKKCVAFVLSVIMIVSAFSFNAFAADTFTAISGIPAQLKLYTDETYQLKPNFPNITEETEFNYSSSNSSVASVDENGLISCANAGTAVITVSNETYGSVKVSLTVGNKASSVTLSSHSLKRGVGESLTLSYKVSTGTMIKSATYKTSNSSVASVDQKGKVTAKAVGKATISIVLDTGIADTCEISVYKAPTSVGLDRTKITMAKGEQVVLHPTLPSSAYSSKYTWKSSNTSVLSVTSSGTVKAVGTGSANIYVYTYNHTSKKPVYTKCSFVIKKAPSSIKLSKSSIVLGVGEKYDLNMVFTSGTYSYHNTSTASGDSGVISIGSKIIVTALKPGTAYVNVKTFNNKTASCKVVVKNAPTSVKCNPTSKKLGIGATYKLSPYVNSGAHCSKYIFKSTNTKICKVSSTGTISAVGYGGCTVRIYTYNHTTKKPIYTDVKIQVGYITNRIASYTTYFDKNYTGKSINLKMAAKYINGSTDGYILKPGQTFSYNKAVGQRTKARGFVNGYVVSGTGYVNGIGGGICQGASTMFNACLYSNVKIAERHNHNLKSSYCPVGRDATVYWGVQDFKFTNNYNTPIRIKMTYSASGSINCSIYTLAKVSVPKISLKVTYSSGKYTLKRYANGKVNYTAYSRYSG